MCIHAVFFKQCGRDIDVYSDCRHIPLKILPALYARSIVPPEIAMNEGAVTDDRDENIIDGPDSTF